MVVMTCCHPSIYPVPPAVLVNLKGWHTYLCLPPECAANLVQDGRNTIPLRFRPDHSGKWLPIPRDRWLLKQDIRLPLSAYRFRPAPFDQDTKSRYGIIRGCLWGRVIPLCYAMYSVRYDDDSRLRKEKR